MACVHLDLHRPTYKDICHLFHDRQGYGSPSSQSQGRHFLKARFKISNDCIPYLDRSPRVSRSSLERYDAFLSSIRSKRCASTSGIMCDLIRSHLPKRRTSHQARTISFRSVGMAWTPKSRLRPDLNKTFSERVDVDGPLAFGPYAVSPRTSFEADLDSCSPPETTRSQSTSCDRHASWDHPTV